MFTLLFGGFNSSTNEGGSCDHPVSLLGRKDKHNHAEQVLKTNLTLSLTFTLFIVLISEACKSPVVILLNNTTI